MDLDQIESQRQKLETQVASLRNNLRHWQTWDAEYEGLKEELQSVPNASINKDFLDVLSDTYGGNLVNTKEIRDLSGLESGSVRTRKQITDLIDHRLVYVTKNIDTLSRQFYAAEAKLEEFDFASASAAGSDPRYDEPDTPSSLIEIHEELDDDDNVISSELRQPGLETQSLLDRIAALPAVDAGPPDGQDQLDTPSQRPPVRKKSVSFTADTKAAQQKDVIEAVDGRKSVSFAPKVAIAPAAAPADSRSVSFAPAIEEIPPTPDAETPLSASQDSVQQQLRSSFKPGETVYELNDDDQPATRHIVLPENESPEDAEMRRQMLNYHLNEVGSVVASIDLEDGDGYDDHSDFASSGDPEDFDTPYTTGTSDTEDEDEYGRIKGSGISEQYRAQMSALSARLLHESQAGAGSSTQTLPVRSGRSSISSIASGADIKERPNSKKRVSFAEVLDVAAAEAPPAKILKSAEEDQDEVEDSGPVVAETLVERPSGQAPSMPPSADDNDTLLARRELATEYYRRRNDMVRGKGGFKAVDEDEQLYEERDGKVKKVSRFKAARLQD